MKKKEQEPETKKKNRKNEAPHTATFRLTVVFLGSEVSRCLSQHQPRLVLGTGALLFGLSSTKSRTRSGGTCRMAKYLSRPEKVATVKAVSV